MDVDAGADDATAILTILGMEAKNKNSYKIEAITTVNGNTRITNVIPNVLKTLKTISRLDVNIIFFILFIFFFFENNFTITYTRFL